MAIQRAEGKAQIEYDKGMPPEYVASRIIRSLEKNKTETWIGSDTNWMLRVNRWFPRFVDWMIARRDNGDVFRLEISGLLRKADLDSAQDLLLTEMRSSGTGSVRLLVVLDAFEGWEPDARWNDLTFYAGHGDALARIAIVGEERWRGHALMFAAADLRKGPVEFFARGAIAEARAWLGTAS